MRDLYHDLKATKSLNAIVGNNSTEGKGAGVDLQFFEGALAVFDIGVSGDTLSGSVYLTLKIQHSDDDVDGNYVDVPEGEYLGAQGLVIDAAAEDEVVHQIGYIGTKRWIRPIVVFTGTHTNGTPISAVVFKGYPRHSPAVS